MANVSLTQAAKLAGISRSNLYKSYIDKGLITVSKDERNKPCIDTSELLRVFSVLQRDNQEVSSLGHDSTHKKAEKTEVSALKSEIEQLKKQLSKSEEREEWYQTQIQSLTDTMKLLEGPKPSGRSWWAFWKTN